MPDATKQLENLLLEWLGDVDKSGKDVGSNNGERERGRNGKLAVIDGKLILVKPEQGGKWPTLAAADGLVKIYRRGLEIKRPIVVECTKDIDLKVLNKEAESSFQITISRDKMEVWLETEFKQGVEYEIQDCNYGENIVVSAAKARKIEPEPLFPQVILAEIAALGIQADLQLGEIVAACQSGTNSRHLIALGTAAKPPVDGRFEFVHDPSQTRLPREDAPRVNLLDRGKINSVEPGEVLAYWHPPVEGSPGVNVFGEEIKPREPRNQTPLVGTGVKLIQAENGLVAVAEIAGRPCLDRGRLCVRPQLVVPSHVDVQTGNIEFTGDVVVLGDVKESLVIKAGGNVEVKGSVYHAAIIADGDVIIHKNLIGGYVAAGVNSDIFLKKIALIKRLVPSLHNLQSAFHQLKSHPKFSVEDLKVRGDGYLIKLILEMRFAEIPKLFAELKELLPKQTDLTEQDDVDKLWRIVHGVCNRFIGANPLRIQSVEDLELYISCLEKTSGYMEERLSYPADITVNYCQKARLDASGSITVTGPLVYGCEMRAGREIEIFGSCRGGSYFARNALKVKSAGVNETVKTALTVEDGGVILAEILYPGTRISSGQGTTTIRNQRRNVQFRFAEGRWVDEGGRTSV